MSAMFRARAWQLGTLVSLLGLAFAHSLRADCVENRVMSLFPKDVSEFACATLEEVRLQPWFADFKGQVLPHELYGLDQFLVSAGINPNSQIKQVAWSLGTPAPAAPTKGAPGSAGSVPSTPEPVPDSDQFLAIIVGQFDTTSIQSVLEPRNLPVIQVEGRTLYPVATSGLGTNIYIMAIDSDTAAVGLPVMLRRLIAVTQGSAESLLSNVKILALVETVNDTTTIWGVFNGSGTRQAIRQLAPGAAQFTESGKLFQDLRSLVMSAKTSSSGVEVNFEISTDSSEDSVMLSQLLQAGLLVRKYIAKQSSASSPANPALAEILDHISVTPNSSLVKVALELPNDQLRDLILQRTFSGE